MEIHCYSQRLLNPFRGCVNCIRYESAEAVTVDGVNWDIYVSNDELTRDLDGSRPIQTSDIRYGRWSEKKGLKRGPIFPSDDFKRMEHMGAVAFEYLLKVHDQLPFEFKDKLEFWLLSQDGLPLALLDSAVRKRDMDLSQPLTWRPGIACKNSFESKSTKVLNRQNASTRTAAEHLTFYVNSLTGDNPAAQWFKRSADDASGYGLSGINLEPALEGRQLPADRFPAYPLNTDHADKHVRQLLDDYIDWQAPWLLILTTLSRNTRQYLEQKACRQALEVEKQYLLYPEIIDAGFIKAARVEAQLRSNIPDETEQDEIMSTFYIELNPSPTE